MTEARYGISGYTAGARLIAFIETRTLSEAHASRSRLASYANVARVAIEHVRRDGDGQPHYTPIH